MKKNRIYEIWNREPINGKLSCWNTTPKVLAGTLEKDLPEVEQSVRVQNPGNFLFSIGDKKLTASGREVMAIVIALLTISFQSIKAAIANPVKSLRTE